MTTAIIGTGGIGSAIARRLSAGGERLRLASADRQSAEKLAAAIGRSAAATTDNKDAVHDVQAVVLALRFGVLQGVIEEIAATLPGKLVVVPSNPVGLDAQGQIVRLLPPGRSSGPEVAGWLPEGAGLAMAFDTLSAGVLEASANRTPEPAVLFYATASDVGPAVEEVERLIRAAGFEPLRVGGLDQVHRLEVGGDLHDLVVGPTEGRSRVALPITPATD